MIFFSSGTYSPCFSKRGLPRFQPRRTRSPRPQPQGLPKHGHRKHPCTPSRAWSMWSGSESDHSIRTGCSRCIDLHSSRRASHGIWYLVGNSSNRTDENQNLLPKNAWCHGSRYTFLRVLTFWFRLGPEILATDRVMKFTILAMTKSDEILKTVFHRGQKHEVSVAKTIGRTISLLSLLPAY